MAWKEWITRLQISQFVLDLGFVYFASWDYFTSTYAPSLPHVGTCAGEPWAAVAGCTILSSYLVLFILFYLATYKSKSGKLGRSSVVQPELKEAVRTMEKTEVTDMQDAVTVATRELKTEAVEMSEHCTETIVRAAEGLPPMWLKKMVAN